MHGLVYACMYLGLHRASAYAAKREGGSADDLAHGVNFPIDRTMHVDIGRCTHLPRVYLAPSSCMGCDGQRTTVMIVVEYYSRVW